MNPKKYSYIILLLYCIILTGCSVVNKDQGTNEYYTDIDTQEKEELEGVWIETEYEIYQIGSINVRVKWFNVLDDSMTFGESFRLDKNVDGIWKQVQKETDINYAFTAIGIILAPNESRWKSYNLSCYTDGLTTGEYRISTDFHRDSLDGVDYGASNYPRYGVYAYFTVGDNSVKRNMTVLELPNMLPGGIDTFILCVNPIAYDISLTGYNKVIEIIGDEYRNSSIRDY